MIFVRTTFPAVTALPDMTFRDDIKRFAVRFFRHAIADNNVLSRLHYSAITLQDVKCKYSRISFVVVKVDVKITALQPFSAHTPVTASTGLEESLKQLASWLDTCNRSHACDTTDHHRFLLSRLKCVDKGSDPKIYARMYRTFSMHST